MIDSAETPPSLSGPANSLNRDQRAILAADISGYTRLMNLYENDTHRRFLRIKAGLIQPLVVSFRGQVVKNTGDGFIACFESCNDAIDAALALQENIKESESAIPKEQCISFRIGLNYGEIFVEPDDVFGHAVNVAARLHDLALPGTVVLSRSLLDQIGRRSDAEVQDLGLRKLKNVRDPVHAYLIAPPQAGSAEDVPGPIDEPRPAIQPTIAVLPFRDLDTDTGRSRFVEGLSEEIASSLAALRELVVISPTSTLQYRSSDIGTAARELGVRYVITGSRQRSRNRLRITVQLNDAESNSILNSSRYEGDVDCLFDLQDRITMDLIGIVAPQIRKAELKRALSKRPDSMDAYDYFLQAVELLRGKSEDEFAKAPFFFRAAMEADENYGPARAYAAFWHIRNIAQGWTVDFDTDRQRAWDLSAAAIECDPDNALGLAIHAHSRSFLAHDYEAALPLFDRALAACPNHPIVLSFASLTHSYVGDARSALDEAKRSVRLAPNDLYSFWLFMVLSVAHYADGNYSESVIWSRRAVRENQQFAAGLRTLVAGLSATNNGAEANEAAKLLMQVDPGFRVSKYSRLCPWRLTEVREEFLHNLRLAGLPE